MRNHATCNNKATLALALLGLSTQLANASDNEFSLGMGIGALHGGLGINFAARSNKDLKYLGLGCTSINHTEHSGTSARCGGSAGWLWTGIVSPQDRHHGFGAYFGPVEFGNQDRRDASLYGAGITYAYFARNIGVRGWTFGTTLATGRSNNATKFGLFLNAGYQF